jgi:hypothetical protein
MNNDEPFLQLIMRVSCASDLHSRPLAFAARRRNAALAPRRWRRRLVWRSGPVLGMPKPPPPPGEGGSAGRTERRWCSATDRIWLRTLIYHGLTAGS